MREDLYYIEERRLWIHGGSGEWCCGLCLKWLPHAHMFEHLAFG